MSSLNLAKLLTSAKYRNQDQTKKAVLNVTNYYKNLHPKLEKVQITKFIKKELLVLTGTIPVSYRSNIYNIPVNLAIPHDYPYNPPICHVCPTSDMTVKVSEHVNEEGRIFLPYLSDWDSNNSDLLGAIQVMIIIFGDKPPVYSRPRGPPITTSTPSSMPPYPAGSNPPYPFSYPAYSAGSSQQPSYPQTSTPSYPSYPGTNQPTPYYSANQGATVGGPGSSDTITSEHIRLSMLTAVEDRLKVRAKEIQQQCRAEIDVLKRTADDLNKGRLALDNIVKNTETNLVEVDKCKDKINAKISMLNEFLAKSEQSREQINIDEHFGPVQPLYKQLFNSFVEENALVDTIYTLSDALKKEVIDLDVYLKYVRELSRRQFTMRALVKLCREKAGLPT